MARTSEPTDRSTNKKSNWCITVGLWNWFDSNTAEIGRILSSVSWCSDYNLFYRCYNSILFGVGILTVLAAIDFLYPEAVFSTEHGVKGEEYDNVVFVISKGWNQYQFETYAPMITGHSSIPKGKEASFERNRNLFYVCCSRPRKRLFFFVTVPMEPTFKTFLAFLVGKDGIYTYQQFIGEVN